MPSSSPRASEPFDAAAVDRQVRAELAPLADPARARPMAAYMKTDDPFFGVAAGPRRRVLRGVLAAYRTPDDAAYADVVRRLWAGPERELRYAAIDTARRWRERIHLGHVDLYRHLVVDGAWWDLVDPVAAHLVGAAVRRDPAPGFEILDRWIDDDDLWLRRTALLAQLGWRDDTDEERLFAYCGRRAHEREFFIRKAIGWALREHAKTAPDAVRTFVADHDDELAPLSIREATKHIGRADD